MDVPRRDDEVEGADGTPVGRRAALGLLGLGAAGVVFGAGVQERIARLLAPIAARDPTGLTQLIPGAGGFRIYTVTGSLPNRSRAAWKLKVHGLVDHPFTIGYSELVEMEPTGITADFQCVTGWRVQDVRWKGVKLADLLERAGVQDAGSHLRLTSFDGAYTESLTLAQARRDDVLVAYEMLGKGVSSEHGGPVRLYVAPMYGYKSLKWLETIEVVDELIPGYWEERGYDVDGWVGRSNGRSDDPPEVHGS
ncbi:molybdopterin-dependent oxidoreductase [Aquihabitans sp. G128]|uniref:molybdopterin-dependent oxidoreductase n=1 Tax=Aquihabitans sp. G128 TaxID=2849779 RepID=UPI001C22FC22|nr:molybdopterin-dependent oxidoreductase [Aquihabitans sp. G128]QXC60960.1 molybdopterin-dependent oxidoreductase [Aquihabitans sp. G128]